MLCYEISKKFASNLTTKNYIIDTEAPAILEQFSNRLNSTIKSYDNAYLLMQILGFIYSWEQDFPDYFSPANIKRLFNDDVRYLRLFEFLKSHNTLNKVLSSSNELHRLMKTIYFDIPNTM